MAFYESAPYIVIDKDGSFEIREYGSFHSVAYVGSALAESDGFNELFNYISGNNDTGKKISMTTPVLNQMDDSSMIEFNTMEFVVPKEISSGRIPLPTNSSMEIRFNEKQRVASVTFSGNANADRIRKEKARLLKWMESKGLPPDGRIYLARYNPPFIPPLLRKNEILMGIR